MTKNTLSRVTRNLGRMQPVWCKNDYGCTSAQNEVSQVGWPKSSFNNVPSNKNKKYLLSWNLSYFWLNIWSMLQWCCIALCTSYYSYFECKIICIFRHFRQKFGTHSLSQNFCCVSSRLSHMLITSHLFYCGCQLQFLAMVRGHP